MDSHGILLVNKAKGKTSFSLVSLLRKITKIKKIGHCGTLDPFATGVMVLLIGKEYTKKCDTLISHDKEYVAEITLGKISPTFDGEGTITDFSSNIPSIEDLEKALLLFQGYIYQTPPMFSAKKINGQRLYSLARKGITIERPPVKIFLKTELISYSYPFVNLHVTCSKGTYIRSIAHDLGQALASGGFLSALKRTRLGPFSLNDCINQESLVESDFDLIPFIKKTCPC